MNNKRQPEIIGILLLTLLNHPLWAEILPDRDLAPLDRPTLPEFEEESPAQVLPDLPIIPPQKQQRLSSKITIFVKQFKFKGNHVFSDEKLTEIVQNYQNKFINYEQLQEAKNNITRFYYEEGYVNSGAIIQDQPVIDGIITITIIEGKLSQVEVIGNERLPPSYIQKRLKGEKNTVLNSKELQKRLLILQQNPLLEYIQAELGPGIKPGEGILKIKLKEARPYQLQFNFDNHRSPSVGAYRGEIEGWHRNTGFFLADSLYLRYGLTEGLNDYTMEYGLPINHYDTTLSFKIERSDSEVIESPFNQLDIESEADTYAISLSHSLQSFKKHNQSLNLALKLEKTTSKTFLLGKPFSFSPGVINGESTVSIISFSQDWLNRSRDHSLAVRSTLNFGIDALGSTINNDGSPDSKFFSWLGQFQYVKQFLKKQKIIFRTDFQWADQSLLPLKKLSIGGASTVRGYRENLITGDNALISSLEWRIPVRQLPISKVLEIALFADYGRAWQADSSTLDLEKIYSIGLGLHWNPHKKLHTQLYWGHALRDIPKQGDKNLQDNGIHFEVSFRIM